MPVWRRCLLLLWMLFSTVQIIGCASTGRAIVRHTATDTHVIFNPHWSISSLADTFREEWPSATGYRAWGEHVAFREAIYDRQGGFGAQDDYYYRRFDSVRIGHGYP